VIGKAEGDLLEVTYERSSRGLRLVLVGVDALHRLRSAAAPKLWEASHTDIVSQIAQKHGLTAKTDGVSTQAGTELQQDQDDAVFLRNLAREHHYYVRVVGKELHFKRWAGVGSALRVTWADDLHDITLRASLEGLVSKVTVTGWDPEADQAVTGTALPTDLKKTSGGSTGVDLAKKAFGELPITLNHAGYVAATNAKARAVAELQRRAERFVSGTARLPGTPKARAGLPFTVAAAGWPFSGTFLIREARHVFDGRYATSVDFVSDSFPVAS
jgi:phage protein D